MAARALGGYPVVIEGAAEDQAVRALLEENGLTAAWIGLTDRVEEGLYIWATGAPLDYTNWLPDEPNQFFETEDCVVYEIVSEDLAGWNDTRCSGEESDTFTQTVIEIPEPGNDVVFANLPQDNQVCLASEPFSATGYECSPVDGTGQSATATAVADVDGDGALDLLYTTRRQVNFVCLADGLGGYADCVAIMGEALDTIASTDLLVADFTLDGLPDVVFANDDDADGALNRACVNVSSPGEVAFECEDADPNVARRSFSVTAADFNGDGLLDVAFANEGINSVCFQGVDDCMDVDMGQTQKGRGAAAGDFDGNGTQDLVFTNYGETDRLCLNFGLGEDDDGWDCSDLNADTDLTFEVEAGDLDGDGDLDLALAINGSSEVCTNDGFAAFTCATIGASEDTSTRDVGISDLDNDGDRDLVFANYLAASEVCLQGEDGSFACTNLPSPADGTTGLAIAELGAATGAAPAETETIAEDIPSPGQTAQLPNGDLLVTSPETGDITRVTPDGTKSTYASGAGTPSGVAYSVDYTSVFTSDEAAGTITQRNTDTGVQINVFDGYDRPGAIAFIDVGQATDRLATLLVTERGSGQVSFLKQNFDRGALITGLTDPTGLTVTDAGQILVVDGTNVLEYNQDGTPAARRRAHDLISDLDRPTSIAVRENGEILVAVRNRVRSFAPDGEPRGTFANTPGVTNLTVLRGGQVLASQPREDRVLAIRAEGTPPVAVEDEVTAGAALAVSAVAPNPTTGRAQFEVAVEAPTEVRAVVYDALGREVAVAHDGPVAHSAEVSVDAAGLAPGVYVVRVTGAGAAEARTFTVVR